MKNKGVKLSSSVREYWKPALLTPLFVVLEVIMEILIPLIMGKLIDEGIKLGSMKTVLIYGLLLLGCAVFAMIFGILAGKFAAKGSSGFAKNLRKDMYYKIQDYSFSNIDKFSTSSIVTRLTTDVNNVQQSFQMITRMAIRAPMTMVIALAVCFSKSVSLSWIFVGILPVMALGVGILMKIAYPLFTKVFKKYDTLNSVVQENVKGVRVVKSFNRAEYEIEKFDKVSEDIYQNFTKAEKTVAFNMPIAQICMYACMLLVSWFGAQLIVNSGGVALSTGDLTSLFTYATQILMSLMMLSMVLVMLTISRTSADRIREILNEKSDITSPKNAKLVVEDGSIEFDHVMFSYGTHNDKKCLDDINFKIKSGETIGIIGGTGSSKSTLVQLIPRLYDVTSGQVKVGNVDVRDYDLTVLRENVAMVLQKNELFSGTIKDNLRWGNESATDEQIVHACKLACADEFIEKFPKKYDTYIEQGGTNVSGGQKQRLCIARAILKNPKILILDDSTSAVDTKTDAIIRDAFMKEIPNTTKIIIAQRVSSVMDADKIIVMDDGKINGFGTHEQLIKNNEIYKEVFESQMKGGLK